MTEEQLDENAGKCMLTNGKEISDLNLKHPASVLSYEGQGREKLLPSNPKEICCKLRKERHSNSGESFFIRRRQLQHQTPMHNKSRETFYSKIVGSNVKNNNGLSFLQKAFHPKQLQPSTGTLKVVASMQCSANVVQGFSGIPASSAGSIRDSLGEQDNGDNIVKTETSDEEPIWKNPKVIGGAVALVVVVLIISLSVGLTVGGSSSSTAAAVQSESAAAPGDAVPQKSANTPAPVKFPEYVSTPSPFSDSKWNSVRGECGVSRVAQELISSRIVGGTEAKPHSWPWQVSLVLYKKLDSGHSSWENNCGGTLIGPDTVITATHCFVFKSVIKSDVSIYRVLVGAHTISVTEGAEMTEIDRVYHHPQNNQATYKFRRVVAVYDFTIVKLRKRYNPENPSPAIAFACLPKPNILPSVGKRCWATGWGQTRSTGYAGLLKQVPLAIISQGVCRKYFRQVEYTSHLCAAQKNMNTCVGDSGGPLVCQGVDKKWTVYGATSFGTQNCLSGPAVHSSISKFMDWLCCTVPDVGPCPEVGCKNK